jgi:DNA-binding IclR family transcriptional regulator
VLEVLRARCNAGRVVELAYATGLGEVQVIGVLYALEQHGLVTPTVWRLADLGCDI